MTNRISKLFEIPVGVKQLLFRPLALQSQRIAVCSAVQPFVPAHLAHRADRERLIQCRRLLVSGSVLGT